jgi:hypothetical protein
MAESIPRGIFDGSVFGAKLCEVLAPRIAQAAQEYADGGGDPELFLEGVLESFSDFIGIELLEDEVYFVEGSDDDDDEVLD